VWKKIAELFLCLLHPIALVLIWYSLFFRESEFTRTQKSAWALLCIIPLVPFVYVLTGHDFL
jgi:hypothetical protein